MRTISFLSPSALKTWETNREEFYVKYLSDTRQTPEVQSEAMSVGSAFDAYVKSSLYHHLLGPTDPRFEFETLFETQVEPDCRTFAKDAGAYCFERYKSTGAYTELLLMLQCSEKTPRFEFTLKGEVDGIPLLGKPDCWFQINGVGVVLDWKVNGYCSSSPTSPKKGYITCKDAWEPTVECKATKTRARKGIEVVKYAGIDVNHHPLEDGDKGWADQLAIYSWMLGYTVGDDSYVAAIDQLACKPWEPKPLIRIAQHRSRVSAFWQFSLLSRLKSCWQHIQDGHIFTDVSLEESQAACEVIDMQNYSQDDEFFASIRRRKFFR